MLSYARDRIAQAKQEHRAMTQAIEVSCLSIMFVVCVCVCVCVPLWLCFGSCCNLELVQLSALWTVH
jgi:hypothetical protein